MHETLVRNRASLQGALEGTGSSRWGSCLPRCFLQTSTEFICKGVRFSSYSNAAAQTSTTWCTQSFCTGLRRLKLAELGGGRGTATVVCKHTFTPACSSSHSLPACDFYGLLTPPPPCQPWTLPKKPPWLCYGQTQRILHTGVYLWITEVYHFCSCKSLCFLPAAEDHDTWGRRGTTVFSAISNQEWQKK